MLEDSIVNQTPVSVTGLTSPGATVDLDEDGDGFDDGTTTAGSATNGTNYSLSADLVVGSNHLAVKASEPFGQTAGAATDITLDVTPPSVVIDSPVSGLVTNTNVTVTGLVSDDISGNQRLEAQLDSGSLFDVSLDSQGNYGFDTSLPLDASADGPHTVRLRATDVAGNISGFFDVAFTLDTIPPAPPVIDSVDQDTGASGNDGVTNDNTLIFSGTAEANSAVTLSEAGLGLVGVVTANGSGVWSIDFTVTALADGGYSFTATAEDLAGNVSSASSALVVVIDTVSPPAPVISGINQDSGASGSDGVTNDNTLAFSGTAEPDSEVMLTEAGLGVIGIAFADTSGAWSIDATGVTLSDGSYSFTATSEDLAGNISADSAAFAVLIDTVAPVAPVVISIDQDTGASGSDAVTNDNTLTFTGTAEAHSVVVLSEAGLGLIGSTLSDGTGAWSIDATGTTLADGSYSFSATAEDRAGNVSTGSVALVVVIDT